MQMRRYTPATLLLGSAFLFALAVAGCGPGGGEGDDDVETTGHKGPKKPKAALTAIEAGKNTTLTGRVVLKGAQPNLAALTSDLEDQIRKKNLLGECVTKVPDKDKDQVGQQDWRISGDGGVRNVVVWIRPPEGSYFKIDKDKIAWDDAGKNGPPQHVALDQPHCAFKPRVEWVFPSIQDAAGKHTPSGQTFVVQNSAPIPHNTNYKSASGKNQEDLSLLPGVEGGKKPVTKDVVLTPDYESPAHFKCDIHTWMEADVWAFDHPYAAITDENGNYTIKNVPAGVTVRVVAWHPRAHFLTNADGDDLPLKKDGEVTEKNFEASGQ
jgi:hypothetical protein